MTYKVRHLIPLTMKYKYRPKKKPPPKKKQKTKENKTNNKETAI